METSAKAKSRANEFSLLNHSNKHANVVIPACTHELKPSLVGEITLQAHARKTAAEPQVLACTPCQNPMSVPASLAAVDACI